MTYSQKTGSLKSRDFPRNNLILNKEKSNEKEQIYIESDYFALKQSETEVKVEEVCCKMDISEATFYNWKKKFGGLRVTELRRFTPIKRREQSTQEVGSRFKSG